jgi:hypothetical protein
MRKADVWALGVTLYIITYNNLPYELRGKTGSQCTTELDILETIANIQVTYPDEQRQVSDDLK